MAEPCGLGGPKIETTNVSRKEVILSASSVVCVFVSLVTILADLTTVILVFAEYCNKHYIYWAVATIIFIIVPNILINMFSMRWLIIDKKTSIQYWITHCFLFGLVERYVIFLHKAFWCKNFADPFKNNIFLVQRNDLNLLHFLYTFTGTVPQMILQTYAIISLDGNYQTRVFSLCASMASVSWACVTYIYSLTVVYSEHFRWLSVILKSLWHFSMLMARLAGILLFTVIFGIWTLVPMGLHWTAMTLWIITQKTTFCPNKLEETLYNIVMGFIYCFCYINLREGQTRYRLIMFYTVMISQNFASLLLYILISNIEAQRKSWSIASSICIIAGTIIGICSMILYYRWFHAKGPIIWKNITDDIELNNKVACHQNANNKTHGITHVRSFKTLTKDKAINEATRTQSSVGDSTPQLEIETDKKLLLDHWIARSGTPTFVSARNSDNSLDVSGIEIYTVENTPQSITAPRLEDRNITKNKTFCSPTELNLKFSLDNLESSIDKITSNNLKKQKRRGICSSDQLRENFSNLNFESNNLNNDDYSKTVRSDHCSELSHDTDGSNKKTSSDSIDMDLDLSFSDINSSDINTFNENIVQKLCLSALKNIKVGNQDADIENIQRIALDILKEMYAKKRKNINVELLAAAKRDLETPTEILSVHDYENICAVNIAREAWGLRSWNGYSDIENWLHDGSVFRDRRRDTLTSASSEISSCLSHELRHSILSAPPFPSKPTYSNVFIKVDKNCYSDYVNAVMCPSTSNETFLAKPCLVDNKDCNHLEPIIEELDDLGNIDSPNKKRLNSERSLVATIDEISKGTISNSPRNVYHRREYNWDSPQLSTSAKLESHLKRALWKEPSKFDSSNIMEALPEKENMFNLSQNLELFYKKDINVPVSSSFQDITLPHSSTTNHHKHRKSKEKPNNIQPKVKNVNKREDGQQHVSDGNIDFLWQYVSDNSLPTNSIEDLSQGQQITSSLQSLISKEVFSVPAVNVSTANKNLNVKRATNRGRPRRKFSILRERFEPRLIRNGDEEILYHNEQLNSQSPKSSSSAVVNVKNQFDPIRDNLTLTENRQSNKLESRNEIRNQSSKDAFTSKSIKEKRSQFMKQVLSPPKFNTKLRYKI